jgi:serine/threonine-protein kinase
MHSVGRYQLKETLGEGAMAKVFKAYDPEIDRTLAIKLLRPELLSDGEYRARFLREAKGAGVLSHSNIVTVFDVGVDGANNPYIAMEYVEGGTLAGLLKDGKPIALTQVVEIGIQLARALDYAHKKGVVHRDVKPSNIMLLKDGTSIKVADFGICHIEDTEATQRTQAGTVLGTPHYMSPEQVLGQKVDARSDIFSAGVVLYQLLTKALPFQGDSLISVAYKITKEEPAPPIDKLRPDVPQSLRRVVERALKKAPDKRFANGDEMARALIEVARELKDSGDGKTAQRALPLRVRWAITMAVLVAVTMTLSAAAVYQRQYQAMLGQVVGYGSSLAKFMAAQNAVSLLAEDWAATETFIQNATMRQDFSHVLVLDRQELIRGSDVTPQLGLPYTLPRGTAIAARDSSVSVLRYALADGREVIDFAAPVLFQGKQIGRVHVGIFEAPLAQVANLTLVLMGILIAITSAAVALGSYVLAQRLATPMRVLRTALQELARGRYDHRIAQQRRDEFGELYATFDETAAALQDRHEGRGP